MLEVNKRAIDSHPTTRRFPRTLQEAYPKDYLDEVIEGPYHSAPHLSEYPVIFAIATVICMVAYAIWEYF